MDNGPARNVENAQKFQKVSDLIAEPFEISTIRGEDFTSYKGVAEGDDVDQLNNKGESKVCRGHQGAAAFLILASGLDKCGTGSGKPLKYSHLDIAASGGKMPQAATGAPVLTLAKKYLL